MLEKLLNDAGSRLELASDVMSRMESVLKESEKPLDKLNKTRLVWDDLRRQHSSLLTDYKTLMDATRLKVTDWVRSAREQGLGRYRISEHSAK